MSENNKAAAITVSIVSHGHGQMVWGLAYKLSTLENVSKIIITLNIPELSPDDVPACVEIIHNNIPLGFGANHNQAFQRCKTNYFGVLNPDIDLIEDPFPELLKTISNPSVGVVGPKVIGQNGMQEDSLRQFPTPMRLLQRYFSPNKVDNYVVSDDTIFPEWIAGMFMLFKSVDYKGICGFDTRYFMYCEDADICTRLWLSGKLVAVNPNSTVIHEARRASRKSIQHFTWHIASLMRYAIAFTGRLSKIKGPMNL